MIEIAFKFLKNIVDQKAVRETKIVEKILAENINLELAITTVWLWNLVKDAKKAYQNNYKENVYRTGRDARSGQII